jgi:hypothetical protein
MSIISRWVYGDYKESKEFIIQVISELDENTEKLRTNKRQPQRDFFSSLASAIFFSSYL